MRKLTISVLQKLRVRSGAECREVKSECWGQIARVSVLILPFASLSHGQLAYISVLSLLIVRWYILILGSLKYLYSRKLAYIFYCQGD